jgi:hypothetical protein
MAIDQLAAFTVSPKQDSVALAAGTGIATITGAEWAESFTLSNPGPNNLYLQTAATSGSAGVGIIIEPGRNASFPTGNGNDLYVQGTPSGSCTITWHDEA